ncbi:uncharacterized protein [Venturia canescens]|uniref:uncharacterized protein n=1 Tax=Venturia canescens TaxID=32260 RepID=UPI001C9CED97|nr:uncharacterized protein LOC122405703 [Venturia canescens]
MVKEPTEAISNTSMPRWYQDLSIPQMENVFALGDIIRVDHLEKVTGRTQRALGDIGVTSTFVKISPQQIKKLRRSTDLDPVKFLSEIYRIVTGEYFTDENYKKTYDCNERIILSAIAFLLLPEIVVELHRRLPMGVAPKLPPKPVRPPPVEPREKGHSPLVEPRSTKPEWIYKKELFLWKKKCEELPIPRVILPPFIPYSEQRNAAIDQSIENSDEDVERNEDQPEAYRSELTDKEKDNEPEKEVSENVESRDVVEHLPEQLESQQRPKISELNRETRVDSKIRKRRKVSGKKSGQHRASPILGKENKKSIRKKSKNELSAESVEPEEAKEELAPRKSRKTRASNRHKDLNGRHRKSKSRKSKITSQAKAKDDDVIMEDNEIHDDRKQMHFEKRPLQDGKETHLIVAAISENKDSPELSITRETSGIACVTPENSDEDFFQALNLVESKKSYPRGRENLSRNWQEWFRDVDEEFMKVEKEADKILKSVESTLRLMGPETSCDPCCSCRQTRKANVKYHKTKTPQMVIESVVTDGEKNKYVVGSLVMNSPAPSPTESTENLTQIIPSYEKIVKNKIISGVINEKGEMNYYVSGVSKETEHVPRKIVDQSIAGKAVKNVPPCGCAIEKMINEGILEITSDDNIPWTKQDQICIGRKYRPEASGATSCRDYPNDRTCRRNPFKKIVDEQIRAKLREREKSTRDAWPPEEKRMYSMADFQPCGDEDGMAVCGGPWGAINIPDEEELARREAEAKRILESPPCGDKPGRAICGAPFGARHPIPKKPKKDEDEDDEEEDEEDAEEKKKKRVRAPRQRAAETKAEEKQLNRDPGCSAVVDKSGSAFESKDTPSGPGNRKESSRLAKTAGRLGKRKKSPAEKDEVRANAMSKSKSTTLDLRSEELQPGSPKGSSELLQTDRTHDDEKSRLHEMKRLKKEWNRSKIMANKLIASPAVLPEEQPRKCQREGEPSSCCGGRQIFSNPKPEDSPSPGEGPFGWRTESERALPAEKTLTYLVEPGAPMDRVPVRPGGKPCECRENRNAKKVLLYNVSGVTRNGKSKRDEIISRVIDGLIYITPEPSARNSEEYIPEYELYESPYEHCTRDRKNEEFKYIEKYLGPPSLMKKQERGPKPCECSTGREKIVDSHRVEPRPAHDEPEEVRNVAVPKDTKAVEKSGKSRKSSKREEEEVKRTGKRGKLKKSSKQEGTKDAAAKVGQSKQADTKTDIKSGEAAKKMSDREDTKWSKACEDEGLLEFYTRCRDNVPCWLRCVEFTKYGCCTMPKRLQVKRPVCECKYERKIVKRDEERKKWLSRQEKLKSCKKQAFGGVEGISRPMLTETNLIVSDVKEFPGLGETEDDARYCIDGVKEDFVMAPGECVLSGIGMHTPATTPEPSKPNLQIPRRSPTTSKPHRHWSPTTLRGSQGVSSTVETLQLRPSSEPGWGEKVRDGREARVDVLFQNDQVDKDPAELNEFRARSDANERISRSNGKRKSANRREAKRETGKGQPHRKSRKSTRSSNTKKLEPEKSLNRNDPGRDQGHGDDDRKSKDLTRRGKDKGVDFKKPHSTDPVEEQSPYKSMGASSTPLNKSLSESDRGQNIGDNVTKSTGKTSPENVDHKSVDHISADHPSKKAVGGDLKRLLQAELEKMAKEGFLFAKLPACHLMPQLQYWIMYRKGFGCCADERKNLMEHSLKVWESVQKPKKMKAPELSILKKGPKKLTYDQAAVVKREAQMKIAQFYSQLRKARVLHSRTLWSLMEFGKFPGTGFKKAFFTYQPSKESDGFVFRPWTNSEEAESSEAGA